VVDDPGCERVVVLGAMAGPPASQFAGTLPERTASWWLINRTGCFRAEFALAVDADGVCAHRSSCSNQPQGAGPERIKAFVLLPSRR
jgi:hypothetical protein